ncbi:MAG: hypothetical protein BroJett022_15600 [Actinomycetes bacterium]|nr:MAG: hypothetical protein BroJett022_15600 [Actinomycetes bacterium]
MTKKHKALATAFSEGSPCRITYRDRSKRWTTRDVRIETLARDHIVARCELRGGSYRRFNLRDLSRAELLRPSIP